MASDSLSLIPSVSATYDQTFRYTEAEQSDQLLVFILYRNERARIIHVCRCQLQTAQLTVTELLSTRPFRRDLPQVTLTGESQAYCVDATSILSNIHKHDF